MADESHCTGLALRFCEQMSQAGCVCKAEKRMKVSGSHVTKLKSFSGTDEESSQYSLIHTLLAVHPVGAYEGGDGSFQSRHRRRLPLCAAVPSAPPHDAAPSVTRKREERL